MLPNELKIVVASVIAFLVTEGLKVVSGWVGKDLSGVSAAIAASLTTAIVVFAEALLALIPAAYQATTAAIFGLLIALLGAFGVHSQVKQLRRF